MTVRYYFLWVRWESALAAAVLDVLLVRPSRKTLDAADAARLDVVLLAICFTSITKSVRDWAGTRIP